MTKKFASTPRSALRHFITSVSATLVVWTVLLASFATTVPFFLSEPRTDKLAWVMMIGIWAGLLIGAVIFTKTTFANWRDYQRVKLLNQHIGGQAMLSSYLVLYHSKNRAPKSFQFSRFHLWLDRQDSVLDSGDVLDGLTELEQRGSVTIVRPPEGDLLLTLTPEFLQTHRQH